MSIKDRAIELYKEGLTNKSEIARIISKETKNDNVHSIRILVIRYLKTITGESGFLDECDKEGIDPSKVDVFWHKSKRYSIKVNEKTNPLEDIDFNRIVKECSTTKKILKKISKPKVNYVDRLVWTDVHVGMDASRKELAMYATEWSESVLVDRVMEMANYVIQNKQSDIIYIDELGDYMDGWDGETTRKGHKLPQNMTNQECFDAGVRIKVMLADLLAKEYKYVIFNNICEDNHSGDFGYVVNSAFKSIIDHKYSNVEVNNMKKFINWYNIGEHCFVLTHGKDSRNLKFGFKPQLDPKSIEKIDQFLKHNDIYKTAKHIEFSKGDSHQCLFDMCSSDDFHYFNYPAFSPSSEWVQTNFKKGRSGFVVQHIDTNSSNKVIKPYFFN